MRPGLKEVLACCGHVACKAVRCGKTRLTTRRSRILAKRLSRVTKGLGKIEKKLKKRREKEDPLMGGAS